MYLGEHRVLDVLQVALAIFLFNAASIIVLLAGFKPSKRASDAAFGYVAGVMLSVSFLSLLENALASGSASTIFLGLAVGVALIWLLDELTPHEHPGGVTEGIQWARLRKAWMIAAAMAIHNIPEGLAVGVTLGFSESLGLATALAIGLHDFIETSTLTASLAIAGLNNRTLASIIAATSAIEAASVIPGYTLTQTTPETLPLLLATAAGSMIYVVVDELIPDIMRETSQHKTTALLGFIAGIYTVITLEATTQKIIPTP